MSTGLVGRLRARIRDDRFNTSAFILTVTDSNISSAILELTPQRLELTLTGGDLGVVVCDLSSERFNTVGRLCKYLDSLPGFTCLLDDEAEYNHASSDLEPFSASELIGSNGLMLRHHVFSDLELLRFIEEAIIRHNPSYTASTLPNVEETLVLMLAQANTLRAQAMDASKRKDMYESVENLLLLAGSFEETYDKDAKRLMRVIPSPALSPQQQSGMGTGDVVVGTLTRRSPRTGRITPMAAAGMPPTASILESMDLDVQDVQVLIRWVRNAQSDFFSYELWRDSTPNVMRSNAARMSPYTQQDAYNAQNSQFDASTTSRLVYRSYGPNSGGMQTLTDDFGQLVNAVVDHNRLNGDNIGLEPERDYYYRLYVLNSNGDAQASEVIHVKTKPLRARFDVNPLNVVRGPAGTYLEVTVLGLKDTTKLTIDGVSLSDVAYGLPGIDNDPTAIGTISGTVPSFHGLGPKDLVLTSVTGLRDIFINAFTVTAT